VYKLTYFNGRGRAETMRQLFALAGVDYEDHRVERDQWPALKPGTPFGQMPLLEVDGVTLCQSHSCARYLARKFNLAGKTELEQAQADMIVDCLDDSVKPIYSFFFEKDEAKKEECKKNFREEQLPVSLGHLENILKSNNGGDGYFVGKELTWADLTFINTIDWAAMYLSADLLASYPKMKALKERVEKLPKVAAWIAKRPKTDF